MIRGQLAKARAGLEAVAFPNPHPNVRRIPLFVGDCPRALVAMDDLQRLECSGWNGGRLLRFDGRGVNAVERLLVRWSLQPIRLLPGQSRRQRPDVVDSRGSP